MFAKSLIALCCALFIFSILSPFRYAPLASFWSEYAAFAGLATLALFLAKRTLLIPRLSLPFLAIVALPLLQYAFGQIMFWQDAWFSSLYLFAFWLAMVLAYSLAQPSITPSDAAQQSLLMRYSAISFVIAGVVSSLFALLQWFGLEPQQFLLVMDLKSNRPYANLGQPNHLATFLLMSCLAALYLYEKRVLAPALITAAVLLMLFVTALTMSRTAWLASSFVLVFLLFRIKRGQFRLARWQLVAFAGIFWGFLLAIPILGEVAASSLQGSSDVVQTASVAQRSGGGFERVQIWQQLALAVSNQPWTGYGWYQVTAAQYATTLELPVRVWLTSSHNIVLDIVVWCGVVLGGAIVLYALYFFALLLWKSNSVEAMCASLMCAVLLIHALLEYPLFYAYFLLPLGVLAGIALAQISVQHRALSRRVLYPLWSVAVFALAYIAAEYSFWYYASTAQRLSYAEKRYFSFDKLLAREEWRALEPTSQVSAATLAQAQYIVQSYLTANNLKKYATLLAHNDMPIQAQIQLDILAAMYREKVTLDDVLAVSTDTTQ